MGMVTSSPVSPLSRGHSSAFNRSVRIYSLCIASLAILWAVVLSFAPSVSDSACDGIEFRMLLDKEQIPRLWRCAQAYQHQNGVFVMCFLELTYLGLKMFAIPATFSVSVLIGALFSLPLAQALTGFGEAAGSTLCYYMSSAIAQPIVERLFGNKLQMLRKRAAQESEHMFAFNLFLRFTPFAPNWFINIAAPLVGIPVVPFFFGSLLGTQLSLVFLTLTGATLRDAGENEFDLLSWPMQRRFIFLGLTMALLQIVPIGLIWASKRRKAAIVKQQS
eukprot:CAMPEP_0119315122 /NCGR_PEP_ID=MMETSP1333-20130426/34545_1 /TAXON_ID=418940 /ORGANISM="Scyphosphaera apsteinii, Strain RCC1455" /LENGTH=275 /DNA_ID=CAMNT_0007320367 /DNA_START=58 /DNA_END=885 /DNA_ORIENTATION=+